MSQSFRKVETNYISRRDCVNGKIAGNGRCGNVFDHVTCVAALSRDKSHVKRCPV